MALLHLEHLGAPLLPQGLRAAAARQPTKVRFMPAINTEFKHCRRSRGTMTGSPASKAVFDTNGMRTVVATIKRASSGGSAIV